MVVDGRENEGWKIEGEGKRGILRKNEKTEREKESLGKEKE